MAVLALVLFVVWVLLAGVGRILLQRYRTGDTGIRSFTARLGSRQWWANRIIEAGGVVVGVAAPAAHLAGLDPLPVLDWTGLRYTGVALAVVGIVATSAAQLAMGGSWRIGVDPAERTTLVTAGPFAVVRNPIFTAAAASFTGLALIVPNPVAIAGLALFLTGVELQVRIVEEPYLRATHGRAYERYATRVGRFLPGVGRLRAGTRR